MVCNPLNGHDIGVRVVNHNQLEIERRRCEKGGTILFYRGGRVYVCEFFETGGVADVFT